jgi:cytoskeleton-associated protein 5
LEKCPKNVVISVLLDLLDVGVSSLHRLSGSDLEIRMKFTELVMKCLWKLTKTLGVTLKEKVCFELHLI